MVVKVVQLGRRTVFAEEEADLREVKWHVQGHLVHVESGLKGRISDFQISAINIKTNIIQMVTTLQFSFHIYCLKTLLL